MPGILPMKMIRLGSAAQSRIAQACDRCRSKKIRCDGVRPTCTQCSNVGFECKTSDKLSRRAFPRGYTESLEDRVRGLEAEVRELKDLLDEKDEKIDMLSRIHSFSPPSRKCSASLSPLQAVQTDSEVESAQEEVLLVEIATPVQPKVTLTGSSTTASFIEAFDQKVQKAGLQSAGISSSGLQRAREPSRRTVIQGPKSPPRIVSDQYINLFFQEWQPLMPILHRPTFLRIYEQYLTNPDSANWQNNRQAYAQLFLIFEIAALSNTATPTKSHTSYEAQWRKALYSTSSDASLVMLQCHVLAQICYMLRADYAHLARHRGIAIAMCHELGLHQGHRYHSLTTFEAESRKKAFWCQYVLDKFTSATTGTPVLFRDDDITTEYPADVDDENLSTQGFSPTLPGELTKISSALALFRVSRILSKALDALYPAKAIYQLSITKLHALSDELDHWSDELPEHLRLRFCNDKPATFLISCRSPLLSLAYFFTRSLIHRPILCHGFGSASSAAGIVLAAAGKHVLQILDLLSERRMNYTFPLNKTDLLLNSGVAVLWQLVDLDDNSKIVKDNQKSLSLLVGMLCMDNAVAAAEFQELAACFVTLEVGPVSVHSVTKEDTVPSGNRSPTIPLPAESRSNFTRKQLQSIASRWSSFGSKTKPEDLPRRATVPQNVPTSVPTTAHRTGSTVSLPSTRSAPVTLTTSTPSPGQVHAPNPLGNSTINLDYFPMANGHHGSQTRTSSSTMLPPKKQSTEPGLPDKAGWEKLLDCYDPNNPPIFQDLGISGHSLYQVPSNEWAPDAWQLSGMDLTAKGPVLQSLLSFSEESLISGEDFLFSTAGSHNGSTGPSDSLELPESYRGITIPIDEDFWLL